MEEATPPPDQGDYLVLLDGEMFPLPLIKEKVS